MKDSFTLYELNKTNMAQIKPYDGIAINKLCHKMAEWMFNQDSNYFMLLSNERRDFTVFNLNGEPTVETVKNDIIELFHNRGQVTDITLQDDGKYEIWLRIDDEDFLYYLFDYDWGVLEY